jgi:transposase
LESLLPDRTPRRGGRWGDHRRIINGVFWRIRTGAPWRDLPDEYGIWQTVYARHRRWSGNGTREQILDGLRVGCDQKEASDWTAAIDATIVRAHQCAAGARRTPSQDIAPERLAPARLSRPSRRGGPSKSDTDR